MNVETTRPSRGSSLGPYVLKMRAIPTWVPSVRLCAMTSASAYRFASS